MGKFTSILSAGLMLAATGVHAITLPEKADGGLAYWDENYTIEVGKTLENSWLCDPQDEGLTWGWSTQRNKGRPDKEYNFITISDHNCKVLGMYETDVECKGKKGCLIEDDFVRTGLRIHELKHQEHPKRAKFSFTYDGDRFASDDNDSPCRCEQKFGKEGPITGEVCQCTMANKSFVIHGSD